MPKIAPALVSSFVVALGVSATVPVTVSASMTLPVFSGFNREAVGSTGTVSVTAEGGATVDCTKSSTDFQFGAGSRNEGPGTLDFSTCTLGGEPCKSLADASGSLLVTGTWHLVLMTKSGIDGHYFLFVVSPAKLHVECPFSAVKLLLFEGAFLGLIAQRPKSTTAFDVTVKTINGQGTRQEFTEYENDAGTGVGVRVKVSQEGGALKEIRLEFDSDELEFESATSIEK
jgi:hypothetical protein